MSLVQEFAQGRVAAEERIHGLVVEGVVAVVRGRREDRGQVQRGDAERPEVVQVLGDAEEIAALEAVDRGRGVPRLQFARLANPGAGRETVREDLIEHGIADPIGAGGAAADVGAGTATRGGVAAAARGVAATPCVLGPLGAGGVDRLALVRRARQSAAALDLAGAAAVEARMINRVSRTLCSGRSRSGLAIIRSSSFADSSPF